MFKNKIIAVDFDGTLFTNIGLHKIGDPIQNTIDYIKPLFKENYMILWTCRSGRDLKEAIKACKEVGLIFHSVNKNMPMNKRNRIYGIKYKTSRKIFAHCYIDDASINPSKLYN